MKPDWKDAPEWAKWLTQNADGSWLWWEETPTDGWLAWEHDLSEGAIAFAGSTDLIGDWRDSLEQRP